jgi:LPPG:FO 2-phospho-L-lactate transferase
VIEAIQQADRVIIAPSNPPLSIGPILAIDEIRAAVESHTRVIAVSPLFGDKALKGPADRVLASLGHEPGNAGILDFYAELITDLVVDIGDKADADLDHHAVTIHATDTRFAGRASATKFASWLMEV